MTKNFPGLLSPSVVSSAHKIIFARGGGESGSRLCKAIGSGESGLIKIKVQCGFEDETLVAHENSKLYLPQQSFMVMYVW